MAAKAFKTTELLYITIQHEYGHVILNQKGYSSSDYHASQEVIMNRLSSMQAAEWGMPEYAKGFYENMTSYQLQIKETVNTNFNYLGSIKHNRPTW